MKRYLGIAALVLMLVPAAANADWLLTPNIGATFGGDARGREHLTYGATIGWMGAGIFGVEGDFAYTPSFFKRQTSGIRLVDSSNVVTAMGNVLIGIPVGGQNGGGFRPYATAGLGLLKTHVETSGALFSAGSNQLGVNVGVGAFGFMNDHVGLRGEIRYYRQLTDPTANTNGFNIDFTKFDFWRGTGGVTFRW